MDMDEYSRRGYGGNGARGISKSSAPPVPPVDRIRLTTYKKDSTHVENTTPVKTADDEPEPHVSLSTIMAVFVSPYVFA